MEVAEQVAELLTELETELMPELKIEQVTELTTELETGVEFVEVVVIMKVVVAVDKQLAELGPLSLQNTGKTAGWAHLSLQRGQKQVWGPAWQ